VRCTSSLELPGLTARLDRLEHHHGGSCLPHDTPHAFIYYITIQNASDRTVTLLGRKWVIEYDGGRQQVIEGDKIVGETPRLAPGEAFSYNSHHVTGCNARVHGGFHGVDDAGVKIHVLLPPFELRVPPAGGI
jgi:ApaG protein